MVKPKLFSIAEIVLLTTTIFVINDNKSAFAANCTKTKSVQVPWSWGVSRTGDAFAILIIRNQDGPSYSKKTDSKTFKGVYTVKRKFNPPTDYCTKKDDPSTEIFLSLNGSFTGKLVTTFIPVLDTPVPLDGPYAEATASITASLPLAPPFTPETLKIGSITIDQIAPSVPIKVGDGFEIPFSGSLRGFAYKDLDLSGGTAYSSVDSQLILRVNLLEKRSGVATYTFPDPEPTPTPTPQPTPTPNPQPTPEPPKPPLPPTDPTPIPEPLTILGSMAALGFGAYAERKRKSSNSSEEDNTKDS
jgi:hypothetical protein